MSITEISALAEMIAAVAVVITLVYLARQIQQSNALARAQTRQRMAEQAQHEVYKGMVEEPSIFRSLYKLEPLSELEWIQLSGWLLAAMRQREYEWFQLKDGNIDESLWHAYRGVIPLHLGNSRTRKWWETWASIPFDPDFCSMVAELLDNSPEGNHFEEFEKIVAAAEPGPSVMPN